MTILEHVRFFVRAHTNGVTAILVRCFVGPYCLSSLACQFVDAQTLHTWQFMLLCGTLGPVAFGLLWFVGFDKDVWS